MTIQPPSNRPREISVTEAIEPAYERVKQMLFKPFDLTKWIIIAGEKVRSIFCFWIDLYNGRLVQFCSRAF